MTRCEHCGVDPEHLASRVQFWRSAWQGQKDLAGRLHERLMTAQHHSEALDHQPTGRFEGDPTPRTPLPRWRRS